MTKAEAQALRTQLASDVADAQAVYSNAKDEYEALAVKYEAVENLIESFTRRQALIAELEALLTS